MQNSCRLQPPTGTQGSSERTPTRRNQPGNPEKQATKKGRREEKRGGEGRKGRDQTEEVRPHCSLARVLTRLSSAVAWLWPLAASVTNAANACSANKAPLIVPYLTAFSVRCRQ